MSKDKGRIIVVGAGSTGASVAYHLAGRTRDEIVLMDRSGIGTGMTSLSTAVVRTHYSNEVVAKMAMESMGVLANFADIGESGFVRTGMLTVAGEQFEERLTENTEMLKGLGIRENIYSSEEASGLFPSVSLDDASLVSYEPDSGYADPVSTANSFARRAKELGVNYVKDSVSRISRKGENADGIETASGRMISFSKLVLCTNVWTNSLLQKSEVPEAGLLPIKVSPHPVVMYRRPKAIEGKQPIVADLINRDYYKPEGRTLLSGGNLRSELDELSMDPDSFNSLMDNVPPEYIMEYSERIVSRIPGMKDATLQGSYYGMYDNTPDEHPIIDTLESLGLGNVFCSVGLSGHGFKLSPSLGKMTSDLILGVQNSNNQYFSLSRFKDRNSIFRKYKGIGTVS